MEISITDTYTCRVHKVERNDRSYIVTKHKFFRKYRETVVDLHELFN